MFRYRFVVRKVRHMLSLRAEGRGGGKGGGGKGGGGRGVPWQNPARIILRESAEFIKVLCESKPKWRAL